MTGFLIFLFILLVSILYPLLSPGDPLAMIGRGTFAAPGTYVSLYDATSAKGSFNSMLLSNIRRRCVYMFLNCVPFNAIGFMSGAPTTFSITYGFPVFCNSSRVA